MAEIKGRTVTVLFSCQGCGLTDRPVKVPAREVPHNPTIEEWMLMVQDGVGMMHAILSPLCKETKCDLKIPANKGMRWLGDPEATVGNQMVPVAHSESGKPSPE
jgi:hypothetical protein